MPPRPQPFGFGNATEIREIEIADQATHVYTVQYEDATPECLLNLVLESLRRKAE